MELSEAWFQEIINQAVEDVELVAFKKVGSSRQNILRLYIDHPLGVTHEFCAQVSSVVDKAIEDANLFIGPYMLEVSSPGIERPLCKRSHFVAQVGKNVYVKTRVPVNGSKVWQGMLCEVGADNIVVEENGHEGRIPLSDIATAHLKYDF